MSFPRKETSAHPHAGATQLLPDVSPDVVDGHRLQLLVALDLLVDGALAGSQLPGIERRGSRWLQKEKNLTTRTHNELRGQAGVLLEVIDDFGLFVQLTDVHHPLGELPPTGVDHLVPHRHLPAGVDGLLSNQRTTDQAKVLIRPQICTIKRELLRFI